MDYQMKKVQFKLKYLSQLIVDAKPDDGGDIERWGCAWRGNGYGACDGRVWEGDLQQGKMRSGPVVSKQPRHGGALSATVVSSWFTYL